MEWKAIKGYEDRYLVSCDGRVKSLVTGKLLTPWTRKSNNYPMYTLWISGARKHRSAHSLVLESFSRPPFNGEICLHKDGDPTNNHISNLRWGSYLENHLNKKDHGTFQEGESHGMAKLNNRIVAEIKSSVETGVSLAKRYGVCPSTVTNVRRGVTWNSANKKGA